MVTTVAGVIGVGNGLLQLLAWWRKSTRPSAGSTTTDIETSKDILAGLVMEQWREETVLRSLGDPEPIPVPWGSTEHEELVDHPRLISEGELAFPSLSGQVTTMVSDFRALRCRRLVILGGPGTGKTTLAVQLLMELLRTRLPGEPVPVLLAAAHWDTKEHPRPRNWLAECLDEDYPALRAEGLPPDTPRALAARGAVLPILDGLDELPGDARAGILAALNRSMGEDDQLIITCRTAQFAESVEALGDVLTAAAVIEPHPLSPEVAADYLRACLPPRLTGSWPHVLRELRDATAPALAEVASTPLGLWLVRATYIAPRQDPRPLLDLGRGDPTTLRDHLCDRLIPALVSSRPPTGGRAQPFRPHHSWDPDQVHRWLTYLARLPATTEGNVHGVAWWHLARYTPTRVVRLAIGLVYGLVVGLAIGVLAGPVAGTVLGLLSVLAVMLTTGPWFTQVPGYATFRLREGSPHILTSLLEGLAIGLLGALVGWILCEWVMGTADFLHGVLPYGLLSGLGFIFLVGVPRWVERPTAITTARSPRSTWQDDRRLTLVRILIGIMVGLLVGAVGLVASFSLPVALVGGLLLGLLIGLSLGRHHAWLAYSLTIPRLASRGVLPLRAMEFLEDAHRLGLLRAEGPFYEFRNIELQEHLSGGGRRARVGQP